MAGEDLKAHAISASQDFYELLSVPESASENEIRRAYRKTALKYHPDKVGANQEALDKFHVLQIAYDVLSDPTVKELYDNARRARLEKKVRDDALQGRRKWMKEDLERRESGALKRKREEADQEAAFERELQRLAEDGKRRRKEREDQLRKEALEVEEQERRNTQGQDTSNGARSADVTQMTEIDRSIVVRIPMHDGVLPLTKEQVTTHFAKFGLVEEIIMREKKVKVEGEKHRRLVSTALIVFKSIVGAHAAVSDFERLRKAEPETFGIYEQVSWAGGKEPDCIPKLPSPVTTPVTPRSHRPSEGGGLRKVPSFASFKGISTPQSTAPGTPSSRDITMIRLRNAERRRLEEKIRAEEATEETTV